MMIVLWGALCCVFQLRPKMVVAGFVASITNFGVFVRLLGKLSALAPKSQIADSLITDPQTCGLFSVGQTVFGVVKAVDVATSRVTLSLKPSEVSPVLPKELGAKSSAAAASVADEQTAGGDKKDKTEKSDKKSKKDAKDKADDKKDKKKTKRPVDDAADAATAGDDDADVNGDDDDGAHKKRRKASTGGDDKAVVPVSALVAGSGVQCRVAWSHVTLRDGVGIDPSTPSSKACLGVTIMGVTGRYTARLSLAECCDVCPYTGATRNPEGFETFKRLHEAVSAGGSVALPVFHARVVHVTCKQGKKGKGGDGKDGKGPKAAPMYEIELTVRYFAAEGLVGLAATSGGSFEGELVDTTVPCGGAA